MLRGDPEEPEIVDGALRVLRWDPEEPEIDGGVPRVLRWDPEEPEIDDGAPGVLQEVRFLVCEEPVAQPLRST